MGSQREGDLGQLGGQEKHPWEEGVHTETRMMTSAEPDKPGERGISGGGYSVSKDPEVWVYPESRERNGEKRGSIKTQG